MSLTTILFRLGLGLGLWKEVSKVFYKKRRLYILEATQKQSLVSGNKREVYGRRKYLVVFRVIRTWSVAQSDLILREKVV